MRGRILVPALLAAACGPAPLPSSSGPLATAAPSPSIEAAEAALAWRDVTLPVPDGAARAVGVLADADGYVIYGSVGMQAAVWTSPDAKDWTFAALPGDEGAPTDAAVSPVATVLMGGGSTSRCAHPFGEFFWRRAPGNPKWAAVAFDESLFCAGGSASIAAGADRLMVAGTGAGEQPFAWQSADGLTWSDAAEGLSFDAPPSALGASDGLFIELGRGAQTDVRVTDGDGPWRVVEVPPVEPAFSQSGTGAEPVALLDSAAGAVAIYSSDDGRSVSMWRRSTDGTWSGVAPGDKSAGGGVTGGVALLGRAYLFLSRRGNEDAAFVTSTDLGAWTRSVVPGLDSISGLATLDRRTVVVGFRLDDVGDETSIVKVADGAVAP